MKKIIKGGKVVDPSRGIYGIMDVYICNGIVKAVDKNIEAEDAEIINAHGKIVIPGLIDMHVHLREPGFEAKENIESGSRAAAAGGYTSVACMPNTNPVIDNKTVVRFIKDRAREVHKVNIYAIGAVTKGLKGEELAEMADMRAAGAVAFSDDGKPVMNSGLMRRALEYAAMFDVPIISHSEDTNLSADGVINEGRASAVLGLKGIPAAAEEVMVARDVILSEMTGSRLHIAHVSTKRSVEIIRRAKERGVKVTAEAAPHHFTLTEDSVMSFDTNTKVNPPLRSAEDVEAVKQGLKDGTIDAIATDHAPHTYEDKDTEYDNAAFGISGIETAIPLVVTYLINTGVLTLSQAVEKLTINPAKILGINKGSLKPGSDADITIIDLDAETVVDVNKFESRGKNSPFNRWKLKGSPFMTIVGGKVVWQKEG